MWLLDAKKSGLVFYVSNRTIGTISYEESSWFTGFDESFYYGKGAYHQAVHPGTFLFWQFYMLYRFRGKGKLTNREKIKWIRRGRQGFKQTLSYESYLVNLKEK